MRDRPGMLLPSGEPEDIDFRSTFTGHDAKYLGRRTIGRDSQLTVKLGYYDAELEDDNPDSLMPDPKPFRHMRLDSDGATAEVRFDTATSSRGRLVTGAAFFGEDREVSGLVGTPNPSSSRSPVTWTPFADVADRDAGTFYLWHDWHPCTRTWITAGGRLAIREGMELVVRPEFNIRHKPNRDSTLTFLTRPVLRDDVSELSRVDDWALRDVLSPFDLAMGGYSQSYELQYELAPTDASLLRLSAFCRSLKNPIVDLDDPRWAPGEVGTVVASGKLRGGEVEWERWLCRNVSAGLRFRFTDADNEEAGGDIPYQPETEAQARLDYIDESGLRIGLEFVHVGERYADIANTTRLGSFELVNLRAAKQLDLHTDLFVTVENVFDRGYSFRQGYPGRGATVQAGIEYRF